jgi:integrase
VVGLSSKKTINERVNGDLLDAIARARQIESRLENSKRSGHGDRKLAHEALLDRYLADLGRRADAGQIAVTTVERYSSALEHYRAFVGEPAQQKAFPYAAGANRDFQLAFGAYLEKLTVAPNGHRHARRRPLRSPELVLGAVRAMFAWAADPDRGNLLPVEFRNPFQQADRSRRSPAIDPFGQPDITRSMVIGLFRACDAFQLPLFTALTLFGLRAAEPVCLFREQIEGDWLKVTCLPSLDYLTKGHRDKRFPIPPNLRHVLIPTGADQEGLLFIRRETGFGSRKAPLYGASLADLCDEYQRRCRLRAASSAVGRQTIRDEILRAAGGLNYDQIQHEFQGLARQLGWPRQATLKDLRHLFSTALENSGVAEFYRRYLMGHALGKTPIVTYTHLNQLQSQFQKALDQDLAPIVDAVARRACDLNLSHS